MPTYDYKCNTCKHRFELFQSIKAAVERNCPKCKKNTLERLIGTGSAIIFKGSGFYQTDYRSEAYKKSAEADKPAEPKPADAKPDSKPDAKPDSKPGTEAKPAPKAADKQDAKPAPKPELPSQARRGSKVASTPVRKLPARKPPARKKPKGRG